MGRPEQWPGSAGEHLLQERHDTAERARRFYSQQVLDHLNERMRKFVAAQEMMFVSTADARGECDSTFRAGPAGFVTVLDSSRVTWPEYRGNGVLASLGNIIENPHVGLLFVDFFREVIGLHVNGHAKIVEDAAMRNAYPDLPLDAVPGRRPERWVVVFVEEAYIHCAKHIPRLQRVPRDRAWGTDDVRRKGGDFFGASAESRPWQPGPEGAVPAPAGGAAASPPATPPPAAPQQPAPARTPGPQAPVHVPPHPVPGVPHARPKGSPAAQPVVVAQPVPESVLAVVTPRPPAPEGYSGTSYSGPSADRLAQAPTLVLPTLGAWARPADEAVESAERRGGLLRRLLRRR